MRDPQQTGRRWLVVGAGGMLGRDVVTALEGRDVSALDRAALDITDPAAVSAAVRGHDVVVSCAGWTAVDDAEMHEAAAYAVKVAVEMDVAPTAGATVEIYWSSSFSGTAGTGNDGGASGADEAYKAGEETEWVKQLQLIGILILTAVIAVVFTVPAAGAGQTPAKKIARALGLAKSADKRSTSADKRAK